MNTAKVAHLTSVHPYNDPRIFHKECHALAQAGFDVTLVAPAERSFEEKGIRVVGVGRWRNRYQRFFQTIPRVLREALKIKADVYHLHDPELLLIVPFLILPRSKVIYDIHEDYVTGVRLKEYLPKSARVLLSMGIGTAERLLSLPCHRIIAERYYKERFPDALEILNYPILQDIVKPDHPPPELSLDGQYHWYLYTGNVTETRGALTHLNLLDANPQSAIAYIGHCSRETSQRIRDHAQTRGIVPERIVFVGEGVYVPKEWIDWLSISQPWVAGVALFPKTPHYERKELTKFFEYMASGLPILASRFETWKALIEDNQVGFTMDIENLLQIAEKSKILESSPEVARTFSQNGKQLARDEFQWKRQAEKLVAYYRKLLPDLDA